ncbi:TetR/AcrR family transcriptional regulator [Nocardia cyriacigeorgica]|uniref:TetR/AcrR family transcriptional regulator n=1 Tax=Nocardia cyriacigeorgica TaxID=135487 RepID=A0A6P1D481_9NOCA|nr:TetR/AcrR family transcriptional regulator [Nocardia cyriacigeorgica]NEW42120.1 TetR/AcrR family transcriptional regulator [Nocardia cyriacigeorgica]NEW44838.1 TetR/AcrR family transcriptional regulator [Nocardia cyriacigeorgica]NEW53074.1 TetR/AcrR family transcriptional regulator [Nocardia cyriacigeorgica]NEW57119.1 TetR/AcrR family transcriptional regulator [Nocardia cyriacigeorgica]
MTRTGRPRGFDEKAVVRGAKELFWRRGYAATSMRELADELGVLPGSLHSALGSKHDLFLRALRDYVDDSRAAAELIAGGSPLHAVRALLEAVLDAAAVTPGRGCMLGNSAIELLPNDEQARELVHSGLQALEQGIETALRRAQRSGEVRADIDCATQARLLVALMTGLHVTARAELDPHRLDDVIDAALAAIADPSSTNRA